MGHLFCYVGAILSRPVVPINEELSVNDGVVGQRRTMRGSVITGNEAIKLQMNAPMMVILPSKTCLSCEFPPLFLPFGMDHETHKPTELQDIQSIECPREKVL